jgi:outer membrane lipoprotein-sorting protein
MRNQTTVLLALVLSLAFCSLAPRLSAQELNVPFSTISGHFELYRTSEIAEDSTTGDFYFLAPDRMLIKVTFPLCQFLFIEKTVTSIYYPDDNRAFRLESEKPPLLPIVPGLLAALRSDNGIAEFGFKIKSQKMKADTIITQWFHPKLKNKVGYYEIAEINRRLAWTNYEMPKNDIRLLTHFQDYHKIANINFPHEISSKLWNHDGFTYEQVVFSNIKPDAEISDEIQNFRIPDDVPIEYKKW